VFVIKLDHLQHYLALDGAQCGLECRIVAELHGDELNMAAVNEVEVTCHVEEEVEPRSRIREAWCLEAFNGLGEGIEEVGEALVLLEELKQLVRHRLDRGRLTSATLNKIALDDRRKRSLGWTRVSRSLCQGTLEVARAAEGVQGGSRGTGATSIADSEEGRLNDSALRQLLSQHL